MKEINTNEQIGMITSEAIDAVNFLFRIFEVNINGFNVFISNNKKLDETKQEWVTCFQNAKLEMHQVTRGANKVRTTNMKYMISPSEFIELCQPTAEDIGAPTLERAFKEACEHSNPATWSSTWSHVAVKEAYKRTGNSQFLNGKQDITLKKFTQHYSNACNDYAAGRIMEQIDFKKPFSSSDFDKPSKEGRYEFSRPGVLKQYENVRSAAECFAICDKLLGKGDNRLKDLIKNLESKYASQGLLE